MTDQTTKYINTELRTMHDVERDMWRQQVLEYNWLIENGHHRHAMVSSYAFKQVRAAHRLLWLFNNCEPQQLVWVAELFNLSVRPQASDTDREVPLRLAA